MTKNSTAQTCQQERLFRPQEPIILKVNVVKSI